MVNPAHQRDQDTVPYQKEHEALITEMIGESGGVGGGTDLTEWFGTPVEEGYVWNDGDPGGPFFINPAAAGDISHGAGWVAVDYPSSGYVPDTSGATTFGVGAGPFTPNGYAEAQNSMDVYWSSNVYARSVVSTLRTSNNDNSEYSGMSILSQMGRTGDSQYAYTGFNAYAKISGQDIDKLAQLFIQGPSADLSQKGVSKFSMRPWPGQTAPLLDLKDETDHSFFRVGQASSPADGTGYGFYQFQGDHTGPGQEELSGSFRASDGTKIANIWWDLEADSGDHYGGLSMDIDDDSKWSMWIAPNNNTMMLKLANANQITPLLDLKDENGTSFLWVTQKDYVGLTDGFTFQRFVDEESTESQLLFRSAVGDGAEIGIDVYSQVGAAYSSLDLHAGSNQIKLIANTSVGDGGYVKWSSGVKFGAFGADPVHKPTGVPVTDAGIHAALVTLGLIAA